MVAAHPFLSDEWIAAARAIHTEVHNRSVPPAAVRMNLVVRDVPFGAGTLDAHVDTSGGSLDVDLGHLTEPDVTVTLDYDTAKGVLVDQDPKAGMQAFMGGRISVEGDVTRLLMLLGQPPDDGAADAAAKIRSITL